jgi:hypothetical protein
MSVNFVKKAKGAKPKPLDSAFERWYETHKKTFNNARRTKYKQDAAYRARVLATSQKSRAARRKAEGLVKPAEYAHNLAQTADLLGVSVGTLRNWRTNQYFPEPLRFGGEVWFKPHQVVLLDKIGDFLTSNNIRRINAAQKVALDGIVQGIHNNW